MCVRTRSLFLLVLVVLETYAGRILQITDFHFDTDYSQTGDPKQACHAGLESGAGPRLGYYGDYMCDSPLALVKHALTTAADTVKPDLVLWTGDNVPHIENYTTNYVINAINQTTSMVRRFFPKIPVLPVFGNHDYAPSNNFPDHNCGIYARTFDLWQDWIGEDQKDTFLRGGFYLAKHNGVKILMLNTNIYYKFNSAQLNNKTDPAGQFAFMNEVLANAERNKEPVHVVAHIPPGAFERTPRFTWMRDEYNRKLMELTRRYANTIKWMIFGHHHTDTFHIVKDDDGKPVQLMLMAPAVTPWFSDLAGAGSNNPSFRIIDYDDNTLAYNDILTYYVNLDKLNNNPRTTWELEYSMKEAYGLTTIDAVSMNGLLEQMKTNDTVFMNYIRFNSVLWDPHLPQGEFRGGQLCSIEFPDLDAYLACLQGYDEASRTTRSIKPGVNGGNAINALPWVSVAACVICALFF